MPGSQRLDVQQMLDGARDALTVKRVYGEPVTHGDVVMIPAARVRGGGGGGSGENGTDQGGGGGFGLTASPAGAFVVRGGETVWQPAVNKERVILASLGLAALTVLALRTVLKTLLRSL